MPNVNTLPATSEGLRERSLGYTDNVDIVDPHVEEGRRAEGDNRRPDIRIGDDLYPEYV